MKFFITLILFQVIFPTHQKYGAVKAAITESVSGSGVNTNIIILVVGNFIYNIYIQ